MGGPVWIILRRNRRDSCGDNVRDGKSSEK